MAIQKEFPEEGELVLCSVEKILKTSVFIKLDTYGKIGIISMSEIAPGRIRNIRDYVTLNKKIVCKVLRIDAEKGHIDLSLRRVSLKERKSLLEGFKKEKAASAILGSVIKENLSQIEEKIKTEYPGLDAFLQNARENPSLFGKIGVSDDDAKKILEIIAEKTKTKKIKVKSKIKIEGIENVNVIKGILKLDNKKIGINYISAPYYIVSIEGENYKDANRLMHDTIVSIKEKAKKAGGYAEESEIIEMP